MEGSCVTDPCWYAVPNATGKEVIIFDVAAGTEENLLAKRITARTDTGAPVAVLCDPFAVSFLDFWSGITLVKKGLRRCRIRMSKRQVRAHKEWALRMMTIMISVASFVAVIGLTSR